MYGLTAAQVARIARAVNFVERMMLGGNGTKQNVNSGRYRGQFAMVLKSGTADTITVGAGRVIAGTTVTSKAATDHTPSGAAGTYYLYMESYYNAGWVIGYASSTTYPTQAVKTVSAVDYPCVRVLIGEVTWDGSAVTAYKQQQYGEIHIAGRWV